MTSLTLPGISASPGIVVGPVHLLKWVVPDVPPRMIAESAVAAELGRLHSALDRAVERLHSVRERAEKRA